MIKRLVNNYLLAIPINHLVTYPSPINLSYLWGFGSLAGLAYATQVISGIFLAMHYTPEITLAFNSVEHIMRDVPGGVGLRYIHANGASMFFAVVYIHMARGLYYGSYMYPRQELWCSGVTIFLLMMATAFLGYVLPWGQMSFWGATVITNFFTAIPFVGTFITQWLWGGFSVDNATLNRFYSLHYLLPFILAAVIIMHFYLLHLVGSGNALGIEAKGSINKINFYPYFYIKDLYGLIVFILIFTFFIVYYPNFLGHSDNYIPADPMVTPAHIVPEWYFLPFYAILRAIPDKLGGVIAMVGAIFILYIIPFLNGRFIKSCMFKPISKKVFWWFIACFLLLGWLGQNVAEEPYITIGRIAEVLYFLYFLIIVPFLGYYESKQILLHYKKYDISCSIKKFLNKNKICIMNNIKKFKENFNNWNIKNFKDEFLGRKAKSYYQMYTFFYWIRIHLIMKYEFIELKIKLMINIIKLIIIKILRRIRSYYIHKRLLFTIHNSEQDVLALQLHYYTMKQIYRRKRTSRPARNVIKQYFRWLGFRAYFKSKMRLNRLRQKIRYYLKFYRNKFRRK